MFYGVCPSGGFAVIIVYTQEIFNAEGNAMNTVVGILTYLLLAPLLAGLLAGLGSLLSAQLQGEAPPHILQPFHKLIGMYRKPWADTDYRQKLLAVLYPALIIISGSMLFAGGNMALSILLLLFAEFIKIYRLHRREEGVEPMALERSIATSGNYACQLLLTIAGFYCFTAALINRGSFLVVDLASTGTAPVLHMPAMLMGFIWLLLFGWEHSYLIEKENAKLHRRERALFVTGNWYRMVTLYAVLFLFNYGGTVLSTLMAVGICLLVWFLGLLLQEPHSRQPGPLRIAAVSAILLIASFINLLILLP